MATNKKKIFITESMSQPGRSLLQRDDIEMVEFPNMISAVDFKAMLKARGDWVELGNADEGKPVKAGSVEAWARDAGNPVGGYYGLRKGYRGRFANYVTPVLELLGFVELEHGPRNNRVRAR